MSKNIGFAFLLVACFVPLALAQFPAVKQPPKRPRVLDPAPPLRRGLEDTPLIDDTKASGLKPSETFRVPTVDPKTKNLVKWEVVGLDRQVGSTYRAKVAGGWLVIVQNNTHPPMLTFLPDANHQWSVPKSDAAAKDAER